MRYNEISKQIENLNYRDKPVPYVEAILIIMVGAYRSGSACVT